jgi:ABC-type phosphate transport system substrate-binding protein
MLGVAVVGAWLVTTPARAEDAGFRVIVHPGNPTTSVSGEFLADAFLKKRSSWDDGEPLRPVDLRPKSDVRRKFSDRVLKRSVAAVRSYWQQQIFSGRGVPPPELDSEEAVVGYVLKHRGAVGYVSGSAEVREAKTVAIR